METYNQEYREKFWENIDSLRKKRGLSWKTLAKCVGVSNENLCHSRANSTLPRLDKLSNFSNALNCSLEDLVNLK